MKTRTIFIGDVHGCLNELKALVEILKPTPEDRIIMLGDLINRGPDSVGTVHFVYEAGFDCLMGNHEDEYLKQYKTNQTYMQLHEKLGKELHDWIESLPVFIKTNSFIAVHAGLEPGREPDESKRDILFNIRTWDGIGNDLENPDNPPWYEYYTEQRPVFYGHWARKNLNIRPPVYGLDSGCVYGKKLSAYILEDNSLIQVKPINRYYTPPSLSKRINRRNNQLSP